MSKVCKMKDKRNPEGKKVVYENNCNECSAVYVGERRTAGQRKSELQTVTEKRDYISHMYKHHMETRRLNFNSDEL